MPALAYQTAAAEPTPVGDPNPAMVSRFVGFTIASTEFNLDRKMQGRCDA